MSPTVTPLSERLPKIIKILARAHPDAKCQLNFTSPFQLLVGTILAAQCTDAKVNEVTPLLFKKYKDPKGFAAAPIEELEHDIHSTGFYKNKSKSLKKCSAALIATHSGRVPEDMDALTALPGVGRKTANVVRVHAYGHQGIIVDTHMLRVSKRLGLTKHTDPDKVEEGLRGLVPQKQWTLFSNVINMHGRRICTAKKPMCPTCPVNHLCPSAGKFT